MDYRRANRCIWFVCHKPCNSHKRANALSKGPLLRVAGRRAQIWYCATMRNLWTPAKPDRRSSRDEWICRAMEGTPNQKQSYKILRCSSSKRKGGWQSGKEGCKAMMNLGYTSFWFAKVQLFFWNRQILWHFFGYNHKNVYFSSYFIRFLLSVISRLWVAHRSVEGAKSN